jgi:prepilin-type N-terminal cleavage/methylation domain-containing protein
MHHRTESLSMIASRRVRRRRGFTLIEMLIAIAIMAVISAIAIPQINTQKYKQDTGARITRSAFQIAGRLAVAKQFDVIVSFDLTRSMVRIVEDRDNDGVADAGERVQWKALEDGAVFETPTVGISGPVASPVVGSNIQTIDGMPSIIFRRNGAASSDLELYIGAGRGNAGDQRAISVLQSTGRASWHRYAANGWKEASI